MRIISSLAFICCWPVVGTVGAAHPSMATQLADYYLKSFTEAPKPLPKVQQAEKAKISDTNVTQIHLSPRAARAVVFNEIFATSSCYQAQYKQAGRVLNPYAWHDLRLFCGTTTTPTYHFLARINKTMTVVGEGALASLLAAPVADLELLTKRQRSIAFLCQDAQVYSDLSSVLHSYKSSEKAILSFWTETDPLYSKEYDKYLTGLFYTSSSDSNKLADLLQRRKIWFRDVWGIYAKYLRIPLIGLGITEWICWGAKKSRWDVYKSVFPLFIPGYNFFHVATGMGSGSVDKDDKIGGYLCSSFVTLYSIWDYYTGYCNYKEYSGVLKNLALRMADLQTLLTTLQKISTLADQNTSLGALYGPQLMPIRALLARLNESSEVGDLLRYLQTLPLRSWSYLSSHAGKLLASYKLFLAHKAVFHDALYALGALDAFVAMATLMKETAAINGPHTYTFTKFLSPQSHTKPRLALVGMWNAMLPPTQAVGNDVTMGQETQSIILTGPNAGGKSTFLTGVATTILLSQTFGIAPAKSCEMTPFAKINTYIDITDDIAAGKSLFLAEVDRFHAHLKLLKKLKAREFSFTIFDEPFSGTNPIEGAAAEYSVLNYIAKYSNALNIVATHYPTVMLLEQREPQKGFKNYKVFIKPIGKDGTIQYTYKVIPGASNQTIAIDILAEQGYATEMLQQARDIISHPEKYKKSFAK